MKNFLFLLVMIFHTCLCGQTSQKNVFDDDSQVSLNAGNRYAGDYPEVQEGTAGDNPSNPGGDDDITVSVDDHLPVLMVVACGMIVYYVRRNPFLIRNSKFS